MTVSHRTAAAEDFAVASSPTSTPLKVARVACCCKLADLLPVVLRMHQEAARNNGKFRQPRRAA
ncbi:hypothetical protein [Hymenobacter psychrophilus]|uniref:Uncharacterized protein n=1 Tax=Hymenobacter psychrophilus TaxID=651662 RepID=A0A1H3EB64_9BACT|nr:hypothetical protein [Hymenobacter psychrophilus]SDX75847.1 hypothetical protein SAMN04488069_10353 [Hymenobacter psychrophilus]